MPYKILYEHPSIWKDLALSYLEREMNRLEKDGWEAVGGIAISQDYVVQLMQKKDKDNSKG